MFYEASDWAKARLAAELTSRALAKVAGKYPPAHLLSVIESMWAGLLVTEGDRRRLRLEIEREPVRDLDDEAAVADLEKYRVRLTPPV